MWGNGRYVSGRENGSEWKKKKREREGDYVSLSSFSFQSHVFFSFSCVFFSFFISYFLILLSFHLPRVCCLFYFLSLFLSNSFLPIWCNPYFSFLFCPLFFLFPHHHHLSLRRSRKSERKREREREKKKRERREVGGGMRSLETLE